MKKLLSLIVVSMFLFSAAGWNFSAKELSNANSQKSQKSTISSVDNTNKILSYASLNAPKKVKNKLIHKTTTVTKKSTHKKGNTTTTTITTKTTKHK